MKKKNLVTAIFVALLAGSVHAGHDDGDRRHGRAPAPAYAAPNHGNHWPDQHSDRHIEGTLARRAFEDMNAAQFNIRHYYFERGIQDLNYANTELQQIRRNVYVTRAMNRNMSVMRRLDYVLRRGDRRIVRHEAELALRVIEDAKTDLIRSGLLRSWR